MNYKWPSMNLKMPDLHNVVQSKKYLLAVSGGRDSMLMAHVFLQHQLTFEIAHVNFLLREDESDGDEFFVRSWAEKHQIPCWVKRENAAIFSSKNKCSIQEAARTIRYDFFYALLNERKLDSIATAHTAQDQVETVLFHFLRGTGIKGLCGIPSNSTKLIRPLLSWTEEEMRSYVNQHSMEYRMDSSNLKLTYTRNKIRLQVLPLLEEIIPSFQQNITQNVHRFQQVHMLFQKEIGRLRKKLLLPRGKDWYIPINYLKLVEARETVLYELLQDFRFSYEQVLEVLKIVSSSGGQQVIGESFRIIKHQQFLIVTAIKTIASSWIELESDGVTETRAENFTLVQKRLRNNDLQIKTNSDYCYVDADKLHYPLTLRPWKPGDYLYPFGMEKKKKVARLLIDAKIPIHEKEDIWVLVSKERIVWVLGVRNDNRFKVTKATKEVIQFSLKRH